MSSTPIILGIETATLAGSVCLARGDTVLASRVGNAGESHSNSLLRDINDVLSEGGIRLTDVDAFAAAIGPGSFTGLRIGLATTKALAATIGRNCIAVPTLKAVAEAAGPAAFVVALLTAGRGEVFAQLFSVSVAGEVEELDAPAHLPPKRSLARYAELAEAIWAGPATEIHRELILGHAAEHGRDWRIAVVGADLARHVTTLALQDYLKGNTVPPELLQALYVRPSDAELKTHVVNH